MWSVISWELKRRRFFIFWWIIGITSLILMTVLAYKAIGQDSKQLNATFNGLASSAGGFFGGSDFFSPIGYLSSQVYYILLPILVIIMSSSLASSLMNRDENDNTVEYTLARPVSRLQLLSSKLIVWFAVVAIVCGITSIASVTAVHIAGINIKQTDLLITHALSFAFSASFGLIALSLMAVSRATRRIATSLAMVLAFGGYIVASLAGLVHWFRIPAKVMPYHYYDTVGLLGGHIDSGLLVYVIGTVIVTVIIAVIGYTRRDIG